MSDQTPKTPQAPTSRDSSRDWEYASPLESHPDVVRAIGMVTVETTILDLMLGRLLGGILGIEEAFSTAVYLTPKSAFARLQMIENALGEYEENDDIGEIRKLIGRAKNITNKRHLLMHSLYGQSLDEGVVRHQMPLTSMSLANPKPIQPEELNTIIADIRVLVRDVVKCAGRLFYERPASAPLFYTPHIQSRDGPEGTPYLPEKPWRRKPLPPPQSS